MALYDDLEKSLESSAPFELFEWAGTYENYFMTSDAVPHDHAGQSYTPVAGLKRSTLKAGTHEEDNIDLTITLPIDNDIVKDYGFQTTPPSLNLTIYRYQRGTGEFVPYWKGPVSSIVINGEYATIRSPSKFGNVLQGNIPNLYVQPPCNNVLFDELCKVSRVANSIQAKVVSVNGSNIVISNDSSFPNGWFTGGEIAVPSRNERRMIIKQDGPQITINYGFTRLAIGTTVEVTAGCDHAFNSPTGCKKFNNQINFGGCPYVPGESNNPFTSGIE